MGERSIISTGRRRSRLASAAALAVAAGLALGAVVVLATVDMPDVPAVLQHVTGALGPWTYALVAALVFMETVAFVGLLMPGEVTLAVAGAAAAHGDVALAPMPAIVWTAGVLGDVTGFTLGRRFGWSLLARVGPRFGLDAARLRRLDGAVARWGGRALVCGRFVGLVRPFAPFAAGASGMTSGRLVRLSIAGVGLWGMSFVLAGYALTDALGEHVQAAGGAGLALVGVVAAIWALRRRSRGAPAPSVA
jgi:membrane protein DedA with SNARE-associated domain